MNPAVVPDGRNGKERGQTKGRELAKRESEKRGNGSSERENPFSQRGKTKSTKKRGVKRRKKNVGRQRSGAATKNYKKGERRSKSQGGKRGGKGAASARADRTKNQSPQQKRKRVSKPQKQINSINYLAAGRYTTGTQNETQPPKDLQEGERKKKTVDST